MPKFIDNYKLETIENLSIDGMEHFIGKQNGSGNFFILKRLKQQPKLNTESTLTKNSSLSNQDLFNKLTYETLILKNISHSSIPKCIRMLKTSNSIYFVWELHPQMSLSEYLRKSWLKIQEKILISVNILQTLAYLHHKNVAFCGLDSTNLKIDEKSKVFFTNFKDAFKMESDSQKFRIKQQIMKRKQFQNLVFRDIYDAAALLFQIFQFKKINPKLHVFSNGVQSKLYKELSLILQKKIDACSLDKLKRILSEKTNIRQTACTQASENAPSPKLVKSVIKRSIISRDSDIEKSAQTERISVSCSKTTLHNVLKRAEVLRNQVNTSRQSQTSSSTSFLKMSGSKYPLESKVSLGQKSKYRSVSELKRIIEHRKLLNLMLAFLNFIEKSNNLKLVYLIGVKCAFYSELIRQLIEECSSKHLEKKEMDFLKVVNNENIKTKDLVTKLKDSIREIINQQSPSELSIYDAFEQALMNRKIQTIEHHLSNQIYFYLKGEISTRMVDQNLLSSVPYSVRDQSRSLKNLNKSSKELIWTKVKRTVSILESYPKRDEPNYQNYKFYYYLSIKLKYGSFDKLLQRKSIQSQNFHVFKDQYFLPFENKIVPVDQIVMQVKSRVEQFGQKDKSFFKWQKEQKQDR